MVFEDVLWDFEGGEGFQEDGPVWEDEVRGQSDDGGKEPRSLGGGIAGGLPGRFQQIENRMPCEGQQIERGHNHGEKLFAVAEIVFEFVAVIFHHVEIPVFDPRLRGDKPSTAPVRKPRFPPRSPLKRAGS